MGPSTAIIILSTECRNTRNFLAQDQQVHVLRPLVSLDALQIAQVTEALVLIQDSHPAENVPGQARDFDCRCHGQFCGGIAEF